MKFIIDRAKWLRGEGANKSFLIRSFDQKMCCLGFYGLACGIEASALTSQRSPETKFWNSGSAPTTIWLYSTSRFGSPYSSDGEYLMSINDKPANLGTGLSESEREKQITAIFAKHDVQVEFIGE